MLTIEIKTRKRLKKGNQKLYNVWIFDLPAGTSGSCRVDCIGCYAKKAERIYQNVAKWREDNFQLAKESLSELEEMLTEQLDDISKKEGSSAVVRIHSSGDFFSREYFSMWMRIIDRFPNISFYAYTKNTDWIKSWNIDIPFNFNLIDSYITIGESKFINFGTMEYLNKLQQHSDKELFICPATMKEFKGRIRCNLNCNYCVSNKDVLFVIH